MNQLTYLVASIVFLGMLIRQMYQIRQSVKLLKIIPPATHCRTEAQLILIGHMVKACGVMLGMILLELGYGLG